MIGEQVKNFQIINCVFVFFSAPHDLTDIFDILSGCAILMDSDFENEEIRNITINSIDKDIKYFIDVVLWMVSDNSDLNNLNIKRSQTDPDSLNIVGKKYTQFKPGNPFWIHFCDKASEMCDELKPQFLNILATSNTLGDIFDKLKPIKKDVNEKMSIFIKSYIALKAAQKEGEKFGL